jgi:hypothetical protein
MGGGYQSNEYCLFERNIVGGSWQVVYAGTEKLISLKDMLLTTDPQP